MKVLVDTSIWSLALRKGSLNENEIKLIEEFKELIKEMRVEIIGPIRQELLSGIRNEKTYDELKNKLRVFEDLIVSQNEYEKAAELFNVCRKNGIQGSHIDFLICAVAINNNITIFTNDKDFNNYKNLINIRLHEIRKKEK